MAAKTKAEGLKENGLDARQSKGVLVWIKDIFVPGDGHPLAHPRRNDPIDRDLVDDIKSKKKVIHDILVREEGDPERPGKKRLLLIDGCRRTVNGKVAEEEMIKEGVKLPDGKFYVPVEFFTGDDSAALLERLRRNTDPLKVPDRASVLAATFKQLSDLHVEPKAIMKVAPNGIGVREIEALLQWDNLLPECKTRFDAGAPIGLLDTVLKAPRDQQLSTLDDLVKSGMTTSKGATRLMNRRAREQAAAQEGSSTSSDSGAETRREGNEAAQGSTSGNTAKRAERPHPKTLEKTLAALETKHKAMGDGIVTKDVIGGAIKGLRLALGMLPEGEQPEWLLSAFVNASQVKAKAPKTPKAGKGKGKNKDAETQ